MLSLSLKKQKTLSFLLRSVIILGSFTSWFAINTVLRLPVIVLVFLFLAYCLFQFKRTEIKIPLSIKIEDVFLIIWILSFLVSILYNSADFHTKYITNTIAGFLVVFGFYFFIQVIIKESGIKHESILRTFLVALLILYTVVIVDFILSNFLGVFLMDLFTFAEVYNSKGFKRILWHSSSSPAEEPGNVAFFLNVYWPFASLYLFNRGLKKTIFLISAIHIVCMILLYSTAGFAFFIAAITFSFLFTSNLKKIFIIVLVALGTIFLIIATNPWDVKGKLVELSIYHEFLTKITLDTKNQSAGDRVTAWSRAYKDWKSSPLFGLGPGISKVKYQGDSYYGLITYSAASLGLIGSVGIVLFLIIIVLKTLFRNLSYSIKFFLISSLFLAISKNLISDAFLNIPFWVSLISVKLFSSPQSSINQNLT